MNQDKYHLLMLALSKAPQRDYPYQSRVHTLRSFPCSCYVKRDDELGFGISGSKVRKFRSLVPDLKSRGIDTVIVVGGSSSNNILGLVQLLVEEGIAPVLFLLGEQANELQGTHLWIRLVVDRCLIRWISHEQWTQVMSLAEEFAKNLVEEGKKVEIIPEGSVLPCAIPGALSLAVDIVRNEKHAGVVFDHLFLDAGTGFQAAITVLAYAWLEKKARFSIVLMAGTKESFESLLKEYHLAFEQWLGEKVPFPMNYELLFPISGKSFGSVNATIVESILHFASVEGILTDPIYSAKLFDTARDQLQGKVIQENTLIVHSGGGLSLSGFQSKIAKKIKENDEQR